MPKAALRLASPLPPLYREFTHTLSSPLSQYQDPPGAFNYYAMGVTQYHTVDVQVMSKKDLEDHPKPLPEGPEPDLHRSNL